MYVKAVSVETCEASNVYTVIPKRKNKRGIANKIERMVSRTPLRTINNINEWMNEW
jgi:hypothetical protein